MHLLGFSSSASTSMATLAFWTKSLSRTRTLALQETCSQKDLMPFHPLCLHQICSPPWWSLLSFLSWQCSITLRPPQAGLLSSPASAYSLPTCSPCCQLPDLHPDLHCQFPILDQSNTLFTQLPFPSFQTLLWKIIQLCWLVPLLCMGICFSWVPHMLPIWCPFSSNSQTTAVSIPKSQPMPVPHMWLKTMKPLSLTVLFSINFQTYLTYSLILQLPITWSLYSCLTQISHQSLSVHTYILQNLAAARPTLSFLKSVFSVISFTLVYSHAQWSCPHQGCHSVVFLPFTPALLEWEDDIPHSCLLILPKLHPTTSSVFPFWSWHLPPLHSIESVLISYLLVDKWHGVFSVFTPT